MICKWCRALSLKQIVFGFRGVTHVTAPGHSFYVIWRPPEPAALTIAAARGRIDLQIGIGKDSALINRL
jgi:hypothetical protein